MDNIAKINLINIVVVILILIKTKTIIKLYHLSWYLRISIIPK